VNEGPPQDPFRFLKDRAHITRAAPAGHAIYIELQVRRGRHGGDIHIRATPTRTFLITTANRRTFLVLFIRHFDITAA